MKIHYHQVMPAPQLSQNSLLPFSLFKAVVVSLLLMVLFGQNALAQKICYTVSGIQKGVCYDIISGTCTAPAIGTLLTPAFFDGGLYTDNGTTTGGSGGTFPANTVGYAPRSGNPSVVNDDNGTGTNNFNLGTGDCLEYKFSGVPGVSYEIGGLIRTINGGTTNVKYSIYNASGVEIASSVLTGSSSKNGGGAGWDTYLKTVTVPDCGTYYYVICNNGGSATRCGEVRLKVTAGGPATQNITLSYKMQPDGSFTSSGNPTYANQAAITAAGGTKVSCALGNITDGLYSVNGAAWYDPSGILITDTDILTALDYAKTNNLLPITACPCAIPSVGGTAAFAGGVVCSPTNTGTVTLTGQTGTVVKWQTSTNGGTNWTDIASTATLTSYNFTNAANNQQYRAVVNSGGSCADATSSPVTLTTSASACSATCTVLPGTIAK